MAFGNAYFLFRKILPYLVRKRQKGVNYQSVYGRDIIIIIFGITYPKNVYVQVLMEYVKPS